MLDTQNAPVRSSRSSVLLCCRLSRKQRLYHLTLFTFSSSNLTMSSISIFGPTLQVYTFCFSHRCMFFCLLLMLVINKLLQVVFCFKPTLRKSHENPSTNSNSNLLNNKGLKATYRLLKQ